MLFKKKKKEEVKRELFIYNVVMKDMRVIECKGTSESKSRLAERLSDILENFDNFYINTTDDKCIVLWTKDVLEITIN